MRKSCKPYKMFHYFEEIKQIKQTLSVKVSWSHYIWMKYVKIEQTRNYYLKEYAKQSEKLNLFLSYNT